MVISKDQTEIKDGSEVKAVFCEYNGEYRCNRCIYMQSAKCSKIPCSEDERDDGRRGYFRAVNQPYSAYRLTDSLGQVR